MLPVLLNWQMEKMSYSFKLQSHPGKLLKDHLTNVFRNGEAIYKTLRLDSHYILLLKTILLLHDLGKASSYFQKYIRAIAEFEEGRIDKEELGLIKYKLGNKKNHALISAIWVFIILRETTNNELLSLIGFITVLKHHGHLVNLNEMMDFDKVDYAELLDVSSKTDYSEIEQILIANNYEYTSLTHELFKKFIETFFDTREFRRRWLKKIIEQFESDLFYQSSLAFSILLAADKGECIFDGIVYKRNERTIPANIVDDYKNIKFGTPKNDELNQLRERVYQSVNINIGKADNKIRFFSINVPTGIGKTFTVLNAAIKLINERSDLNKIIYCLPFTSVIDQNSKVFEDILETNQISSDSEKLLINHHLAEIRYSTSDDEEIDDNKSEYLITQFESAINVTTFYQLLHGIFSGKNNELKKLHSFANSIIILDEVQSIPSKYWPLIKESFTKIAEKLNITFIFVTATLPMIFDEEKGEIVELVENKKQIFNSVNRIQLNTALLDKPVKIEEFMEILTSDIDSNPGKSFLIILNTIKSSKKIFKELKDLGYNVLYLSTNIPPVERLKRIKKIKEAKEPLIVVSTQLVEAGVDIDLDIVYRDLAPLDSIFQSAGRCNRNSKSAQKGIVKVFSLQDSRKLFANYIYGFSDLDITKQILKQKELFNESDFFELGKQYFKKISETTNFDDSEFILKEMHHLNYANAFDINTHKQAFELIENRVTYPAYIAFDDDAQNLLEEYEYLINRDFPNPFDKKRAVKNILKKLSMYAVSVPEKYSYNQESPFYVISQNQKDFAYDKDTGIEFENENLFVI